MSGTHETSFRLEGVTRTFPGVVAVDRADLTVRCSEVHGIIGKNGAGKSVLVSMIAGVLRPDSGSLWVGEQQVDLERYTPGYAHELGVSLIPQEPLFAPYLTVADNLFMGRPLERRLGFVDHQAMNDRVREICERLGVRAAPGQRMKDLPIEEQQILAFGKALFVEKSQVILLDEITASLSRNRKVQLLKFLKQAVADTPSLSFTLISHHINEIMEFCDRVTVMRDGRAVETLNIAETSKERLAAAVVGDKGVQPAGGANRSHQAPKTVPFARDEMRPQTAEVGPILEVRGLTRTQAFEDLNLQVSIGDVVGLAGLDGSGKDEFLGALFGLEPVDSGVILVQGKPVRISSPRDALKYGIEYLPKKREEKAVIHNRSVEENILLPIYPILRTAWGLIDYKRGRNIASRYVADLSVKTPSLETRINHLSGGNRQKVMIGRLATMSPSVFLLNEPTRGVDLGAKPEILRLIRETLCLTSGVVVISESEEELLDVCDQILIFYRGKIRRVLRRSDPDFTVAEVYKGIQGIEAS